MSTKVYAYLFGVVALLMATPHWAQSPTEWEVESPCFHEMLAMASADRPEPASPVETAGASCPCFDAEMLSMLPQISLDLCVQGAYVEQVTSWYGRNSAAGREGFNVLVATANPRSPDGSCQFLHRNREAGEMQQIYRRPAYIAPEQAVACRRILHDWLESRGGCSSIVAGDTSDQ